MVGGLDLPEKFKLKRLTDYLAVSLIFLKNNFIILFKQVFSKIFVSIIILVFIYITLGGEFNLAFFISNDGKIFIALFIIILFYNLVNLKYQSFKIIFLPNLIISFRKVLLKIILMFLLKVSILISIALTISELYYSILLALVYLVIDAYSYKVLYDEYLRIAELPAEKNYIKLKLFGKSIILLAIAKIFTYAITVIVTFSIFFVNEFIRILITKKLFFFVHARSVELYIFSIMFVVLSIFLFPIQYFCVLIFYKMNLKREN